MKRPILPMLVLIVACLPLGGCKPGQTDVTHSPRYHFSSFAGTVWKTKVKVALADIKEYTGARHLTLLAPFEYDPANPEYPKYQLPLGSRVIRVLPVGTRIRIARLMFDDGEGGVLWVTAHLDDGTYPKKVVYVNWGLLAKNVWLGDAHGNSWGVNPKYLESEAPSQKIGGVGK